MKLSPFLLRTKSLQQKLSSPGQTSRQAPRAQPKHQEEPLTSIVLLLVVLGMYVLGMYVCREVEAQEVQG